MEQSKLEEIMEFLKAGQYKMETKTDKLAGGQEELTMSRTETTLMMAEMKATIKSGHEEMIKAITEACLVKESTPEEIGAVAEPQEVPEGATDEEAIGVTEDRSRNLRLAVGCRGRADQTRWSVEARVCRRRRTAIPSFSSCAAQGRTSQGTGQEMPQWHKSTRQDTRQQDGR
jgi:hypothetical protein